MRRLLVSALLLAVLATPGRAGVRVVEDEVIFTLRAGAAQSVYIVGDFNNWNPTAEPMERDGDAFEISLFLVPGTYRYKFVVDGRWIVDPDNPGDAEKGSFLTLEERAGGYALSTDEPAPERAVPTVTPTLRYIGEFRYDNDDGEAWQLADLFLNFERSHLRGAIDLQSPDHSWAWSPPSVDVDVSSAFVEVTSGPLTLRGFDNDSTWTSRGPVTLVGNDGVFDYNSGFERHGFAAELDPSDAIVARMMVVDRYGDESARAPAIAGGVAASFGGGVADTTAYAYSERVAGADQGAVEVAFDASDFAAGYVVRFDRGLNPGVLADLSRGVATTVARVYATREDRDVSLYWLRLKKLYGFDLSAAYGRGSSDIHALRRGSAEVTAAADITEDIATDDADSDLPLLTSDRATVDLRRLWAGIVWHAGWDMVTFDYDARAAVPASADVHRWRASVQWQSRRWRAALSGRLSDQDYGDAPADLHVDSPARNIWLYGRDEFTVGDIAALGHNRYADVAFELAWTAPEGAPVWAPRGARAEVSATGNGVLENVELLVARAGAGFEHGPHYYAFIDGRLARYDRADWGAEDTFASGWVEVGYRRGAFDVNLGYGFDPVAYDPVVTGYADTGRERWLRRAIASGVRRDGAVAVGERLLDLERALQASNAIKLECTITF